jgi:hypothetical protein
MVEERPQKCFVKNWKGGGDRYEIEERTERSKMQKI